VIPDSLAGLLLFAASIGPGYVYIRVAERRRPRAERSQLLEAAELLVLGALITTVVAMLVVSVAQQVGLVDVATVHREGLDYLLLHPVRGFATLGAIFGLSYLGGGLVGWVAHLGEQASQQPGTVWRDVFGQKKETNDAWATVELRDGRFLQGQVVSYTLDVSSEPRELALAAPLISGASGAPTSSRFRTPTSSSCERRTCSTSPSTTKPNQYRSSVRRSDVFDSVDLAGLPEPRRRRRRGETPPRAEGRAALHLRVD